MKTPIVDFVKRYVLSDTARFHMPGHKGKGFFGVEAFDITEVYGADVLNEANGIIGESEQNATQLFGTSKTFYSTEGSSQVIKTMLAVVNAKKKGRKCRVIAARNVHKAFVYGVALCDIDVEWLYSSDEHLCSCKIEPQQLKEALANTSEPFDAVYVTSPDYLGNVQDIKGLAKVCKEFRIPLLVDNAHGAYLAFLSENKHPINLGASMCADSAHKTLPVLTGGAYLHVGKDYEVDAKTVRDTMSVFGSSSPSYLVLQSLDDCNRCLSSEYKIDLHNTVNHINQLKVKLKNKGFELLGDEELKLTVDCAKYGYKGEEIAEILRQNKIEVEFADERFVVMMFSASNDEGEIEHLEKVLCDIPAKTSLELQEKGLVRTNCVLSIRDAVLYEQESVSVLESVGRVCGVPTVSCPPAVPIVVSGEIITQEAAEIFRCYGIDNIQVVKSK